MGQPAHSSLKPRTSSDEERDPASLQKPVDFALGFHAPNRYSRALDIDYCHLATPTMNMRARPKRSPSS